MDTIGETHIIVRIRKIPEDENFEEVKLLVDTGATYSWINKRILEKLKIEPIGKKKFKTISGTIIERKVGYVFVEYDNEAAPTVVVFAEDGDAQFFGLHGMESLGLEIDPVTRQIRKSEALLAFNTI